MVAAGGFWCYVRDDDTAEGSRITQLGRDIVAQYELLSGQFIDLFVDQSAIAWGDDWRERIDEALESIAFFIPVITPRFFLSRECRSEFQRFVSRASVLGVEQLILPLVYVNVTTLQEEDPTDDIVRMVKQYQWEDWRDLRFADRGDGVYRRAVASLAERILAAEGSVTRSASFPGTVEPSAAGNDEPEPPGLVDLFAAAEDALPRWTETVQEIGELVESVGRLSREASEEMSRRDAQGKGFAGRIAVIRQLATTLAPPSDRLAELSSEFTSYLYQVDQGFKAMIERAPHEVRENESARVQVCQFFGVVVTLSSSAREGMSGLQTMVDSISGGEALSRDLRPPLRTLRTALTAMIESKIVTDEWVRLISASQVDCTDLNAK